MPVGLRRRGDSCRELGGTEAGRGASFSAWSLEHASVLSPFAAVLALCHSLDVSLAEQLHGGEVAVDRVLHGLAILNPSEGVSQHRTLFGSLIGRSRCHCSYRATHNPAKRRRHGGGCARAV